MSPSTSWTETEPAESTIGAPDLLEVGRITKAHGLKGEVVVALTTNRDERVAPGTVLSTERGDLRVVRSSPFQGKWIVQFEGVRSRDDAEALRNQVLSAPPLDDDDADWIHELIGADVVDQTGSVVGKVEAVQDNPVADLLVLASGALVPMTFVVETGPGRVVIDAPDGLLDL